jgi:hypothetical protein
VASAPADVEAQVRRWLAGLEGALDGPVTGLYLVGSVALDDFSPQVSNIDLVVCGDAAWSTGDRQAVAASSGGLERRGRAAHVDLVTYDGLEGFGSEPDPYTRDLLHDAPALRGRRRPPAALRDGEIEAWAQRGLDERVRPWLRSTERTPVRGWTKGSLGPVLLDACRLYAATQGHVLSKTEAAEMVVAEAPRSARRRKVLSEALSHRHGASTSNYWGPVERKRDALRLMAQLLEAPRRAGTPGPR